MNVLFKTTECAFNICRSVNVGVCVSVVFVDIVVKLDQSWVNLCREKLQWIYSGNASSPRGVPAPSIAAQMLTPDSEKHRRQKYSLHHNYPTSPSQTLLLLLQFFLSIGTWWHCTALMIYLFIYQVTENTHAPGNSVHTIFMVWFKAVTYLTERFVSCFR